MSDKHIHATRFNCVLRKITTDICSTTKDIKLKSLIKTSEKYYVGECSTAINAFYDIISLDKIAAKYITSGNYNKFGKRMEIIFIKHKRNKIFEMIKSLFDTYSCKTKMVTYLKIMHISARKYRS